jgi:primosomal replication protein N
VLANSVVLSACVVEVQTLRYTPAGVPALNLVLEHESETTELDQPRQVKAAVKAVAFGAVAERLAKQAIGSVWRFNGFLANATRGKTVILHIQEFSQD